MSSKIQRVLIKRPESAYLNQSNIDKQADKLNYYGKPIFDQAVKDYQDFYNVLKGFEPLVSKSLKNLDNLNSFLVIQL